MAEHARALVLTYAAALANDQLIAAAWEDEGPDPALRGVAVAMVERHEGDRHLLGVNLHGAIAPGRSRAFWTREGEDRHGLAKRLLSALAGAGRERGAHRMVVSHCPVEDTEVIAAAEALGARRLPAPSEHVLQLAPGTSFKAYLGTLRAKRKNLVRDLRRAGEAGAVIERECPATPATLERVWPLQLDTFARKGSKFVVRGNLFLEYRERVDPARLAVYTCSRDGELLGFLVSDRVEPTASRFAYVGHVAQPPLQVYVALIAEYLRLEIDEGVSTFYMGTTSDAYKSRLGCRAEPCVNLYLTI